MILKNKKWNKKNKLIKKQYKFLNNNLMMSNK